MATSRTGTAEYKRWRRGVLKRAQRDGITHCPRCGVKLDYVVTRKPDSAEPDHTLPWVMGGRNTSDNGRVLCRLCNGSRGKDDREARGRVKTPIQSSSIW